MGGRARHFWASAPRRRDRVLFYRSKYLATSLFVPALSRYLDAFVLALGRPYPLNAVVVTNSSTFLSFAAIRRFSAAVLFPWDLHPMALYELYSLSGPVMFVPDPLWFWKIQQFAGFTFSDPIG